MAPGLVLRPAERGAVDVAVVVGPRRLGSVIVVVVVPVPVPVAMAMAVAGVVGDVGVGIDHPGDRVERLLEVALVLHDHVQGVWRGRPR